jgi:virginiamycin B lyase
MGGNHSTEGSRRATVRTRSGSAHIAPGLLLVALTCAIAALCATAAPAHAYIYWTNYGTGAIRRANLDGTDVNKSFITASSAPGGVAVDGAHIYWTNGVAGTIGRANLDGTGVDQRFITGANSAGAVAVDGAHIYWTNESTGTIGRANLDGTGVNNDFMTGAIDAYEIAVDGAHIYWIKFKESTIGRANLDGSGVDQSFITSTIPPLGIAVDGAHIYWSDADGAAIGRANLDGTGVNQSFIPGASASAVAVDGAHIYWGNIHADYTNSGGTIGRANLDGTGANNSFIPDYYEEPSGVAVDALGPAAAPPSLTGPIGIAATCAGPLLAPGSLCSGQIGSRARDYTPEFDATVGSHNPDHDSAVLDLMKKMGNGYQSYGWGVSLLPSEVRIINRSKVLIEVKHPIGHQGADGEIDFTFSGGPVHTRSTCGSNFHVSYGTITGTIQIKVRDRFFKTITITRMRAQAGDSPVDTCNPSPTPCSPPGYFLGGSTPPQSSAYKREVSVGASKPPSSGFAPLAVDVLEPTAGTPFTVIDADMVLGGTKTFLKRGPNLTSAKLSTPGGVISGGLSVQSYGISTTFPERCKVGHDQITIQPVHVTEGKVTATFDSIGKVSIGTNSTFSLNSTVRVP